MVRTPPIPTPSQLLGSNTRDHTLRGRLPSCAPMRELEIEFSTSETIEVRAVGRPMKSRWLRAKSFDGFFEQRDCSVWHRVFGEILLVEIQCLGNAGDATPFDEKVNVQTVSRTTASPHFHCQHRPLIGRDNLNVPRLEYRLPVGLLECRYEL